MKRLTAILAISFGLGLVACGGGSSSLRTISVPPPPSGGEVTPNYFNQAFQQPYKQFMQALVTHYSGNPSIGYIRFGLAQGGETYPNLGFDSDATCSAAFTSWGWSPTTWTQYLTSMLDYEATLGSQTRLMVGLNTVNMDIGIPDAVAAEAVKDNIGIGTQGFQQSDTSGGVCIADWCNLFNLYTGQVPLELQTATQSDPTGAGLTGSLTTLLPFALQHNVNILELYYQDWLTAYDPSYSPSDATYATAIQQAASAGIQMEVIHPPSTGSTGSAVQQYLMTNPAVNGINLYIEWAAVDQGPNASPQYDWSSTDSALAQWTATGKKVNFVVWPVADNTTNTSTPQYVLTNLGASNTTTCSNTGN